MNINIDTTNIHKLFLQNFVKKNESQKNLQKNVKTIKKEDFTTINEINICKKIKNIPYYSNNYLIVEDYDLLHVSKLNDKFIEKFNLINENNYLVFTYKNNVLMDFNDYFLNLKEPKLFILNVIETFSYILHGLIKLNEYDICFFNLSPQNIVFNLNCGTKPQLQNFHLSLLISKINEDYITNIIQNHNDYTHKPLECHILFYLIHNDMSTISYSFIEEICDIFVNKMSVLCLFSEKYKESYKLSCIEVLKKYINKSKADITRDILNQIHTWDIYSFSVLFLHIFGNISRIFSLKSSFINKITLELSKNIHPDPSKRGNLHILIEVFNNLLENQLDWSFISKLPSDLMSQLFYILAQ